MNDVLRDEIVAEINEAFAGVCRGSTTLHEALVLDAQGSEDERKAARARDTEQRWQDVPDAVIESHHSILRFLCPESFRYYIAAYMVWSLRHHRESESLTSDFTIYALSPRFQMADKFASFSPAQARAVQRYLQFMAEHGEDYSDDKQARFALKAYWNDAVSES